MEKLGIPIPSFILHRRLVIGLETTNDRRQLTVRGVDVDGTPVTYLQSVKLAYNRRVARSEPFVINFRGDLEPGTQLKIELECMGHYGEPNLEIDYEYQSAQTTETLYLLAYNPHTGEWNTTKENGSTSTDRQTLEKPAKPSTAFRMPPEVNMIDLTA